MTPLLQKLKQSIPSDPIEERKRVDALHHIHHPIPPISNQQDRQELILLLEFPLSELDWNKTFHLMLIAYKYRHYLHCMTMDNRVSNKTLIIHDRLEIKHWGVFLDGKIMDLEKITPKERLLAKSIFEEYLTCLRSTYRDKAHIINQIVFGPQTIQFSQPKHVAMSRGISKKMTHIHPAEKQIQYLQEINIPLHIIRLCHLDDIVGSCPKIPDKVYNKDVLPVFASSFEEDHFHMKRGVDVHRLVNMLFPLGKKQCIKYIFHKLLIPDDEEEEYISILEIHIRCKVVVMSNECVGLFSLRFYNQFVEFTETTIGSSSTLSGEEYFLHYNKEEGDDFLGWKSEQQYQYSRNTITNSRIIPEKADLLAKKIAHLLKTAFQVQTTKTEPTTISPLFNWKENVLIFPSLS